MRIWKVEPGKLGYVKEIEENAEEIIEAYIDNIEIMSDSELKNKIENMMEEE